MPPKSASAATADNHEVRIQKLEENLSEMRSEHSTVKADVRNLVSQVADGFTRVQEKIDSVIQPLATKIQDHVADDEVINATVAAKLESVKSLVENHEEERVASAGKWKGIKTAILSVIIGALAIGAKELVVWLAHR